MTPRTENNSSWELDQLHRDEITVAMSWVVRTCQEIVRDYSHKVFWVPAGTPTGTAPTTAHLINSARTDVLNKLQRQISGAEAIISYAEEERAKRKR